MFLGRGLDESPLGACPRTRSCCAVEKATPRHSSSTCVPRSLVPRYRTMVQPCTQRRWQQPMRDMSHYVGPYMVCCQMSCVLCQLSDTFTPIRRLKPYAITRTFERYGRVTIVGKLHWEYNSLFLTPSPYSRSMESRRRGGQVTLRHDIDDMFQPSTHLPRERELSLRKGGLVR